MKYEKITVIVDPMDEEMASYLLFECSAAGLNILNPNDKSIETGKDTYDYVDDNAFQTGIPAEWLVKYPNKVFISLFFENKNGLKQFHKQAKSMLLFSYDVICETVDEKEWINVWKQFYEPFQVGALHVVPLWKNESDLQNKIVLDPGIAFGTGQHETTSMILQSMQQYNLRDKRVIDVGCGSGILGIGALVLGAKSCHFIDVEERAVEIAKQNAEASGVKNKSTFEQGYFTFQNTYDIVLANLTASILNLTKHDLVQSLNNDGVLFASGIIDGKQDEVKQLFEELGLKLLTHEQENDWHSYVWKKDKI